MRMKNTLVSLTKTTLEEKHRKLFSGESEARLMESFSKRQRELTTKTTGKSLINFTWILILIPTALKYFHQVVLTQIPLLISIAVFVRGIKLFLKRFILVWLSFLLTLNWTRWLRVLILLSASRNISILSVYRWNVLLRELLWTTLMLLRN